MALFTIWHEAAGSATPPFDLHERLLAEAHIVPERITALAIDTAGGRWQLAAFACASAFYPAEAQLWLDGAGGACVIHGLIWRIESGGGRLLDAGAVAALLDRPGRALPDDVAGEFAVARLHRDGTLEAFSDRAGLHQLFRRDDGSAAVSNRAGLLAALAGDWTPDSEAGLWLTAMGYRAGERTGWRGVAQLPQGARLVAGAKGARVEGGGIVRLPAERGFARGGGDLVEQGLAQARSAILLAAGTGPVDLPLTGGKDSRVVLAIALAAGLRDRLTLFTRGYAGHPDVVAAETIARAIGVSHRREDPLGSSVPGDLTAQQFVQLQATIAYQADGGMGGWDNVSGTAPGTESLISGHMGELLKAYAKRPLTPGERIDPVAMVRLQAPFDPMGLLGQRAHAMLSEKLAAQMEEARAAGAREGDLPDLFYWRNRIPNWLGGIRGIKSFERQPVLPLGVPALIRLAFLMTPEERKAELAHYRLIEAAAPELLPFPFAHQSWDPSLGTPATAPLVAASGGNLFGTWQWTINRSPRTRAYLAAIFADLDIPLWGDVDRAALLDRLHNRRFDYFDGISLLGLTIAALHQGGMVFPAKLGRALGAAREICAMPAMVHPPRLAGHFDGADGAATAKDGVLTVTGEGRVRLNGWLHAPDWPGASVGVEARADGRPIASGAAGNNRADLAAAGIGDGRHGFLIQVDASAVAAATTLRLMGVESEQGPQDGAFEIVRADRRDQQ